MSSATPIVPGLIPRRSINLVIGSSFSGKTSLILPQLNLYAAGDSFMGYRIGGKPEQLGAIACNQTMDTLYYDVVDSDYPALREPRCFPIHAWNPAPDITELDALEVAYSDLCQHANSKVKFLFVDGIQGLMTSGKVNDQHPVREFFRNLHKLCSAHDLTILGTIGTAKMKRGESYPQLSERVLGSSVWSQESQTLIGVEIPDLHLPTERRSGLRRVVLQPRRQATVVRYADFDAKARLMLVDRPDAKEVEADSPAHALLNRRLDVVAPGTQMKKEIFIEWGETAGISQRTVDRWLAIACHEDIGLLLRSGATKAVIYTKPIMN